MANVDALRNAIGQSFLDGGQWTQDATVADEYEVQQGKWKIQATIQVGDPNSNPPKPFFWVKDAQIEADGLHMTVECAPGYSGGDHPGWTHQSGSMDYYTTIPFNGLSNVQTGPPAPPEGAYQEFGMVGIA